MTKRIRHLGIVVRDVDAATEFWCETFGMTRCHEMVVEEEGIRSIFISVGGTLDEMAIELVEPLDQDDMDNPIARRLATKGEGFYHICLGVESVAESAAALEAVNLRVIRRNAVSGDEGRWLVHPKDTNGVMVEGIEGL